MNDNYNQNNFNGGYNPNESQMPPKPEMNNYPGMNNMYQQQPAPNNKKTLIIIGVAVLVTIIAIVLILVLGKKDDKDSLDDHLNQQEIEEKEKKEEAELNKNYTIKDYMLENGNLLIEFTNNNNVIVDAKLKIDFYDEAGTLVNTEDSYISFVDAKSKGYYDLYISSDKKNYSTYKITAKVSKSYCQKLYNDKIEVLSYNNVVGALVGQVKNNHTAAIDHAIIFALFYDNNNKIIGANFEFLSEIGSGETMSFKINVPYDKDYKKIKYSKVELSIKQAYLSEN